MITKASFNDIQRSQSYCRNELLRKRAETSDPIDRIEGATGQDCDTFPTASKRQDYPANQCNANLHHGSPLSVELDHLFNKIALMEGLDPLSAEFVKFLDEIDGEHPPLLKGEITRSLVKTGKSSVTKIPFPLVKNHTPAKGVNATWPKSEARRKRDKERHSRNKGKKERDAKRGAKETPEARQNRLKMVNERHARSREEESPDSRRVRLEKKKEYDSRKARELNPEARQKRLDSMKDRNAKRRAEETPVARQIRLDGDKEKRARKKEKETPEARRIRLEVEKDKRARKKEEKKRPKLVKWEGCHLSGVEIFIEKKDFFLL